MPSVFSMFCMGPIVPEKIILTGIITVASGVQLIYFARRVYKAREKHNISITATTGHPEFERTLRAQQCVLEWNPVFMTTLWTTSLFLHQVPAAICGLLYLISRHRYFNGYTRSEEERLPGLAMGSRVLMVMTVMSVAGIGRTVVRIFLNRHHHFRHGGWGAAWRGGAGGPGAVGAGEAFPGSRGVGGGPGGPGMHSYPHPHSYPHNPQHHHHSGPPPPPQYR